MAVEAMTVKSPCHYLLPPPQNKQGLTGNFRELATDIISIKTNKEQSQKRGGSVLYARQTVVKNAVYCNRE
jgi:hypothetical protein